MGARCVGGALTAPCVAELVGVTGAGFAAKEGARFLGGLGVQAPAEQKQIFVEFVEQQFGLFGGGGANAALHFVQAAADDGEALLDELMKSRWPFHGGQTRRRFLGLVGPFGVAVGDFAAEDADMIRRGDAEPDDSFFDADHLNGGFHAGEDERFVLTPRQNEHDNPFTKQPKE
jgi:hypothetical protein